MSEKTTTAILAKELADAMLPLSSAVGSADGFCGLLQELGWQSMQLPEPIANLRDPLAALANVLGDGDIRIEELDNVLGALTSLIDAIQDLRNADPNDFDASLVNDGFLNEFPSQLIEHLLIEYLDEHHPVVSNLMGAAGIIRLQYVEPGGARQDYIRRSIEWGAIPGFLSQPSEVIQDALAWGTSEFDYDQLFEYIMDLAEALGLPVSLEQLDESTRAALETGVTVEDDPVRWSLKFPVSAGGSNAATEAGIMIFALPGSSSRMPGLGLLPYASGSFAAGIDIAETFNLRITTPFDMAKGVAVLLRPDRAIEVLSEIAGGSPKSGGEVRAELTYTGSASARTLLLGSSEGTRLEAAGVTLTVGANSTSGGDLYVEAAVVGGRLVLSTGDAGGFIGKLLGNAERAIPFTPVFGISAGRGFYLSGSSTLAVTLPMRLELGPITIEDISIAVEPGSDTVDVEIGAVIIAELGPFFASAEIIGLQATFEFPGSNGNGGNLGPLNVALAFLPPTIVVFTLESAVINGGGFVQIDPEIGRYSGGLALDLFGVGISAIVIVDTEIPGDANGWALFASLGVTFITPLPLGFGFTLIGVGGLLALNRTINVDELALALKTGAADAILFPDDIRADSSAVLAGLDSWFPLQEGTTVVGPVVEIGWGTPTLISAQLGIVIAIPDLIVTLLGSVEMLLPTPDEALISLRMDVIGAVDTPASTVIVAASLHDSNLLGVYELSGDMGFYARLSDQPLFLLSVGGYHPQFDPPGALPGWLLDLRRLSAAIELGDDVAVVLTTYVAVTSNTVQFGGSFTIVASVKVLFTTYTAEGGFAVNVLLVLKPFKIVAAAGAWASISAGDRELMGVQLTVHLEGPRPWYATGKAYFTFFGLDVDFGFDVGSRPGGAPREVYPVGPDVAKAMRAPDNWAASEPAGAWGSGVVIGDQLPAGLWVRPDQTVEVRQSLAPLNRTISAYGEYIPAANRIEAGSVTLGGRPVASPAWVEDWFAPAQFDRIGAGASLSAPSYELMVAGLRFGDDQIGISGNLNLECTSATREPEESIFQGKQKKVSRFVSRPKPVPAAASRRKVRGESIRVSPTKYTVICNSNGERDGTVLAEARLGTSMSYADAVGIIARRAAANPAEKSRLRVAPAYAAIERNI